MVELNLYVKDRELWIVIEQNNSKKLFQVMKSSYIL